MGKTFSLDYIVRWPDTDMAGVAYFARYFDFFEIAENEFYRQKGLPQSQMYRELKVRIPRVSVSCEYRGPARLDDELRIDLWVRDLNVRSFTFGFRVVQKAGNAAIAEGSVSICVLSLETQQTVPIPDRLRALLEPYYQPAEKPPARKRVAKKRG